MSRLFSADRSSPDNREWIFSPDRASPRQRSPLELKPDSKTPRGRNSPKNTSKSRDSPGLLNRISHHIPQGTFIPISTTFKSITDSKRTSSEVSWNLITTFDQPKLSQEAQIARPAPITIAPTDLNNMEVETGLLMSQMTQTDIIGMPTFPIAESKEVQTDMPARTDCDMQASGNSECKEVQTEEIEIDS